MAKFLSPLLFLLFFMLQTVSSVWAQDRPFERSAEGSSSDDSPPKTELVLPTAKIGEKKAELGKQIRSLRESAGARPSTYAGQLLDLFQQLDLLYDEQLLAIGERSELNNVQNVRGGELDSFDQPDSYSFLSLDRLRDRLNSEVLQAEALNDAVTHTAEALQQAKRAFEVKETARRQAKELSEKQSDLSLDSSTADIPRAYRLAQIESGIAGESVYLLELQLENVKERLRVQERLISVLRGKLRASLGEVKFTKTDLQGRLVEIEKKEFELERLLESAKRDLSSKEQRFLEVKKKQNAQVRYSPVIVAELEARRLQRESAQEEVRSLASRLQHLRDMKVVWERRFKVFNQTARTQDLPVWRSEAQESIATLDRSRRLYEARSEAAKKEIQTLSSRIKNDADEKAVVRWLDVQLSELELQVQSYDDTIADLEAARQMYLRLLDSVQGEAKSVSFMKPVQVFLTAFGNAWNYEFAVVDDSSITVGKVISAILLLFLGYRVARVLSVQLGTKLLPRFDLTVGVAHALQSLAFYFLILVFTLFALRLVHIPLTLFTVLGGALAIGVGFGSQNVVNNFISGLILLVEQPVRVGDVIEFDGLQGTVRYIGLRSTTVLAPTNEDIIVPNSTFLENNVINWTLANNKKRLTVKVGIAYGSSTRKAASLIKKAVSEHGRVLKDPQPIILFQEFGDNALNFEVYLWIRMKSIIDCLVIASDVRFRIDNLFRSAGIVIAYPQRDLHLDTVSPLEVRMVGAKRVEDRTEESALVQTQFIKASDIS